LRGLDDFASRSERNGNIRTTSMSHLLSPSNQDVKIDEFGSGIQYASNIETRIYIWPILRPPRTVQGYSVFTEGDISA